MTVTLELGKTPLASPAVSDAELKSSSQYESMSMEIAKLSSIQDAGHVRWAVVVEACQQILSEQAKDIPSAVYLAIALAECEGLHGWYTGGRILADVLQCWWEEALPPKKRMRARVNAVDWWHERSKSFLGKEHAAITIEEHQKLTDFIKEFDGIIGEKLSDCQPLYDLREVLQRLEVEESAPAIAEGEGAAASSHELEASTEHICNTSSVATQSSVSSSLAEPVQSVPSAQPTQLEQVVKTAPLIVQEIPKFDAQDPELVQKCQKALGQMARQYYDVTFAQACPQESLAWHSLYIYLWGNIGQMPTAQGRQTLVPTPDSSRLIALQTLLAAQKFEQAVKAACLLAPASPFCLDIQYIIAQSLQGLIQGGSQGFSVALAVMEQHTKQFIQRFKGIENLLFTDETPFASEACRAWLESLQQNQEQGVKQDSAAQTLAKTMAEAQRLCHEKHLPQALDVLNSAMKNAAPAAQLRLQITQVRLLNQEQHFDMAVALTENILHILDKHQLDQWDKQLCEEALLVAYAAYKGHDGSQAKMSIIAQRLAILNPSAALKLL